jgi:hypothetical protein
MDKKRKIFSASVCVCLCLKPKSLIPRVTVLTENAQAPFGYPHFKSTFLKDLM